MTQRSSRSSAYGKSWAPAAKGFLLSNPLCVMCRQQGRIVAATQVDHIKPHKLRDALDSKDPDRIREARRLFWDRKNWQGLCDDHHNVTKQRIERRGYEIGADEDGRPLDPSHHWNTPKG